MNMKVIYNEENGFLEAELIGNCDFALFYQLTEMMEKEMGIEFTGKLDDADSIYWDFTINGSSLTVHYNVYLGISLLPAKFASSSAAENKEVKRMADRIAQFWQI